MVRSQVSGFLDCKEKNLSGSPADTGKDAQSRRGNEKQPRCPGLRLSGPPGYHPGVGL